MNNQPNQSQEINKSQEAKDQDEDDEEVEMDNDEQEQKVDTPIPEEPEMSEEQVREMKKAFKFIDADKNGTVTKQELLNYLRSHDNGLRITPASVANIARKVDVDGDGVISFEEFSNALDGILERFEVLKLAKNKKVKANKAKVKR